MLAAACWSGGDGILIANFRTDRVRQILFALLQDEFEGFARRRQVVRGRCGTC